MSKIINLQSNGGYHFRKIHHLKPFIGHHFEEKNSETNIINKAVILNIECNPDKMYLSSDGYAGNCWTATVLDSIQECQILYNFRNFRDLVMYYEKQGFKFV